MVMGRKLRARKTDRWGTVEEMTFATPESPAATTEAIARVVTRFADWSLEEALEDSIFAMPEKKYNEEFPFRVKHVKQAIRAEERALLAIFGAASGCATVVDARRRTFFILGREHNIDACYINWASTHNLRNNDQWADAALGSGKRVTWMAHEAELAARNALFGKGTINVLKPADQQDSHIYRAQIAARIGRPRLRHFVAEKFPDLRVRGDQDAKDEVVLRSRRSLGPFGGMIIGGAVWDREHYAFGMHVVEALGHALRRNPLPSGADSGGGRWWDPE